MDKTDLSPIIQELEHLKFTELRVLVVMYHCGKYLEPDQIQQQTGACMKSIKAALKSENVKTLLKKMNRKSDITRLLSEIQKELERK